MNENVISWLESGSFFRYKDLQIFYTQSGQGPDLLIIHGYPYSSYEWKECIDVLCKEYKVTALDLLGMGFSDKPADHKYSYEEHCDIINSLLASLNITETQILSHDLGVSVVQELIARDLDGKNNFRIVTSAFSNGSLFTSVYRPRLIQRLLSQTPKLIGKVISRVISKNAVNNSVKSVYGKNTPPSDALLDELWDVLNYNNGKDISYLIGRLIFQKVHYQNRWISAMQKTNIPMCYICGPSDPNSGKHMADEYLRLLPKSKVLWMRDDIGHWPMIEDKGGFLDLYLEWMRS